MSSQMRQLLLAELGAINFNVLFVMLERACECMVALTKRERTTCDSLRRACLQCGAPARAAIVSVQDTMQWRHHISHCSVNSSLSMQHAGSIACLAYEHR